MELNDKVHGLVPATGTSPLAGTRIDLEHHRFYVYWADPAPDGFGDLQSWASQRDISLIIKRATFSEQQLMEAARQVTQLSEADRLELSVTLHTDGSGITVSAKSLPAAASGRVTPTRAHVELLRAIGTVRAKTGVPVAVEDLVAPMRPQTRRADYSPYWGGAITRAGTTAFYGRCTSGFSAYATGDPSIRHMLTAGHCSLFNDGVQVSNGAGFESYYRMGRTEFVAAMYRAGYDSGTIHLDSGKLNEPKVYNDYTGSNPYEVFGYASFGIPAGGHYCVSGAFSAPRCNLRSGEQVRTCWWDGTVGREFCASYIRMISTDGSLIWCHGDSGGPIYYWDYYFTGIYAAGMVGTGDGYFPGAGRDGSDCALTGGASVVVTAMNSIPGLMILSIYSGLPE